MNMKKRTRSPEFDVCRQTKVHVGQKEVNNGVYKKEYMQNIHDKTLKLLKEGAKNFDSYTSSLDVDIHYPDHFIYQGKNNPQMKLKQTFLSNELKLQNIGKQYRDTPVSLCGCCRIIDSQSICCNKCDQILCSSCLTDCANCSKSFCQNCILQTYDNLERNFCLDCYH